MAEELKSIENFKPESSERNIERLDELTKNDLQLKKERSGELKRRRGIKKQRAESRKSSDFNSANLTREFGAIQNSNFKEEEIIDFCYKTLQQFVLISLIIILKG
jgi:hypothetical protein